MRSQVWALTAQHTPLHGETRGNSATCCLEHQHPTTFDALTIIVTSPAPLGLPSTRPIPGSLPLPPEPFPLQPPPHQPVGPIMRMFLGMTSSRTVPGSCMRRQRLRSAIATARLASSWPCKGERENETMRNQRAGHRRGSRLAEREGRGGGQGNSLWLVPALLLHSWHLAWPGCKQPPPLLELPSPEMQGVLAAARPPISHPTLSLREGHQPQSPVAPLDPPWVRVGHNSSTWINLLQLRRKQNGINAPHHSHQKQPGGEPWGHSTLLLACRRA